MTPDQIVPFVFLYAIIGMGVGVVAEMYDFRGTVGLIWPLYIVALVIIETLRLIVWTINTIISEVKSIFKRA